LARLGGTERNTTADLIAFLEETGFRAGFFQVVRLFNRAAKARGKGGVGGLRPRDEPVRFRAATGMRHPGQELTAARLREGETSPELTVSFLGLTGPTGVLPDHYSEFLVEQGHARNPGASDFFDLFTHRMVSLFYRAWAKYRLPIRYEEASAPFSDPFSRILAGVSGVGLKASEPLLHASGGDLLGVSGVLGRRVRSADGLRRIISALYGLPVEVREFGGRWIPIPDGESSSLSRDPEAGRYAILGQTAVVGRQVYDVQSRFQLRLGPMDLAVFKSLLGGAELARTLQDLVRLAVGPARDFDVQLVLKAEAVPRPQLLGEDAPRLGQTSWLLSTPSERDRDDAVLKRPRP
jgi:type VI secretion system protein ImpH